MSAMTIKVLCSSIISIMGLIVVKYISGSTARLLNKHTIIMMSMLIIIPAFLHSNEYIHLYTVFVYIMTVFIYKEALNISLMKAIISCGILIISMFLLDFSASIVLSLAFTKNQIRSNAIINISMNIIFSGILIFFYNARYIRNSIPKLVDKLENRRATKVIVSIVLSIIAMSIILYVLTSNIETNSIMMTNFFVFLIFFVLIIVLLGERNNFENLSDEYYSLFKYVNIFEEWIEKEQLTRHEYKNQLAVLRNLTKERKVKDKIDSIVDDFINIDNQMISQLKSIPNGGLKGLLYYKISIAKKNRVNLHVYIEETTVNNLSQIKDDRLKVLTKLLGIYLDNAIEAALDTKKKNVTIEIYEIKNQIKIVISNSFNKNKDITNRNLKGISTKGKGRGNGLYFANKLISMNKWIEEKQEVSGVFYIQSLVIDTKKA